MQGQFRSGANQKEVNAKRIVRVHEGVEILKRGARTRRRNKQRARDNVTKEGPRAKANNGRRGEKRVQSIEKIEGDNVGGGSALTSMQS